MSQSIHERPERSCDQGNHLQDQKEKKQGTDDEREYIESLRKLKPTVYMSGEQIENVLDNPRLRAGIEATGATYELAEIPEYRELIVTQSKLIDEPINCFNNPPMSVADLVPRVKMNRLLGQRVGTCFQRCTGQDCLVALSVTTYDVDRKYGTEYNKRFLEFLKYMQKNDLVANAGGTDVKGDRNLGPMDQPDNDLYLHVVEKRADGIVVRGAKYHQTGSLSVHEFIVLPTRALKKGEEEFAVACFSAFHRQSHGGCKAGKIDCMVAAALTMMAYNGTEKVSHHKEKVIDMLHRAETLYGCSLAASYEGKPMPSGTYFIDPVLANASKIHEGKEMAEATRLMIDLTGGFVADLPSEVGPFLKKYLKGSGQTPVENRVKMFRLIEKMAMKSADTISDIHG